MKAKYLTTLQIQELHKLVERNAIKYYDVEVEIVDHYASAIEEIWAKDPSVSFYRAQMMVYKEFWDFQDLEKEKMKKISIQAYKDLWTSIKSMFGWPKILELLLIFAICWIGITYFKETSWAQTGFGFLPFVFLILFPNLIEGNSSNRFDKAMGKHFLNLHRVTMTYSFFPIIVISLSSNLFEMNSLVPCAFSLAIYFMGTKDMHYILKEERKKIKQQFALNPVL